MHKHIVPRASQPVRLRRNCLMTLSPALGSLARFTTTKAENLKTSYSIPWRNTVEQFALAQPHIILRGTARQSDSTKPSLPCYARCPHHRNLDERIMSTRWCMPTTVRGMTQQGTHPSSRYLVATQEFLWT